MSRIINGPVSAAVVALAALSLSSGFGIAYAQVREQANAPALEEVVVTARRQEENLLQVPVAVSVMSAEQILETGVTDIKRLSDFTPGLFAHGGDPGAISNRSSTRLTFRGLSTSSGVAFIDGTPFSGGAVLDVTDVARIEVLKGPQSVYFGRSTFSGAVNYVTKAPGDKLAGRASIDVYNHGGRDIRAMLEAPLLHDGLLSGRISARHYSFDGQYRNGVDKSVRVGDEHTKSLTVALYSTPRERLNLSAYYTYNLNDDGVGPQTALRLMPSGNGTQPRLNCNLGGTFGNWWCGEIPGIDQLDPATFGGFATMDAFNRSQFIANVDGNYTPFAADWLNHFGTKKEIQHSHFKAEYETESGWQGSLLLGYTRTMDSSLLGRSSLDTSNLSNPFYFANANCVASGSLHPLCKRPITIEVAAKGWSEAFDRSAEIRVSSPRDRRLRGTLGSSYYLVDGPPSAAWTITSNGIAPPAARSIHSKSSTPAVFGGLYYDITPALKLGVEGRYQWDKILQQAVLVNGPVFENTYTSFSPRVTLDYQRSDDQMYYASYSKGFLPGGFNTSLSTLTPYGLSQLLLSTNLAYEQEQLVNYEIGHKARWLNNRLRTTLALYMEKWTNGKVVNNQFVANVPGGPVSTVSVTSNVGKVDLSGAELEVNYAATTNLTLAATIDYSQNKILAYIFTPQGEFIQGSSNVNGRSLARQPKWSASFSPSYKGVIGGGAWNWNARLDALYRSKMYVTEVNAAWRAPHTTVNGHLGLSKGEHWKVESYVINLFDDDTATESVANVDGAFAPNTTCPPCYNPALPLVYPAATSNLNVMSLGLPYRRTFGLKLSYEF